MSENLPKSEGRGKAAARRRWGLYVQVLVILLLLGAGIGLAIREAPSSDTPGWKVRALVAELERQDSDDLVSELLRKLIPRYGDGREWFEVSGDLTALGVEAVPEIITVARRRLHFVRMAAASALGKIGDRRAVAPLADLLARDTDWEVREMAAYSLGQLGGPEAIARLIKAMSDPEPEVRKAAAWALGKVSGPEATARLIEAMADFNSDVRCAVTTALGHVGGPEVTARLTEAMTDPDPEVRNAAREALRQIRQAGQAQAPSRKTDARQVGRPAAQIACRRAAPGVFTGD